MSKFKIKFSLEKVSLEIEGERDDIPHLRGAIQDQLVNLLPTKALTEATQGQPPIKNVTPTPQTAEKDGALPKVTKPVQRRAKRVPLGEAAIDFRHDTEQFGFPLQSWSCVQKAIWLLYVVQQQKNISELSSREIADTFNKHFRQANPIVGPNVNRDLGKERGKNLNQDTSKSPATWFLTAQGITTATELISEVKKVVPSTAA